MGKRPVGVLPVEEELWGDPTPLHVHSREKEAFYVLFGRLAVWVDGTETVAAPGMFLVIPRGAPHAARRIGDEPPQVAPPAPGQRGRPALRIDRYERIQLASLLRKLLVGFEQVVAEPGRLHRRTRPPRPTGPRSGRVECAGCCR